MALAAFLFSMLLSGALLAQKPEAEFPIVKQFGGIYPIENATYFPDADRIYNIVIEVKTNDKNNEINVALINIARLMNLHVMGGVKPENLHVVAIIHGSATTSIMNDDAYLKRFNVKNPNTDLIKELRKAGLKILICGQSMLARNVREEDLAEGVEISLSMLTAFTTYQLQGYASLQF